MMHCQCAVCAETGHIWLCSKLSSTIGLDMRRTTQLLAGEAILPYKFETSKRVRASEAQQAGCAAAQTLLGAGEDEVSGEGVTGPKLKKLRGGDNWCHWDDTVVLRVRNEAVAQRLAVLQVGGM